MLDESLKLVVPPQDRLKKPVSLNFIRNVGNYTKLALKNKDILFMSMVF